MAAHLQNIPKLGSDTAIQNQNYKGNMNVNVIVVENLSTNINISSPPIPISISDILKPEKPGSKVSPSASNASSNTSFCRICHEGESMEILVAPCKCTGTVALIHQTCLEHWLTSSNSDKCEICKHQYNTAREPRSCVEYVQDSANSFNVRNLIADVVCFFLLTPLLIVSTYLCIIGANQYILRERWEAVGLIVLSLFLISVYLTWCHVTIKFHITVWLTWQRTNQRVRLIEIVNCRADQCSSSESSSPYLNNRPQFCSVEITPTTVTDENVNFAQARSHLQASMSMSMLMPNPKTNIEFDEESLRNGNECADTSRIIL